MRVVDVIAKKRDGGALSREEIDYFVDGVSRGTLPDYQASALLMARTPAWPPSRLVMVTLARSSGLVAEDL